MLDEEESYIPGVYPCIYINIYIYYWFDGVFVIVGMRERGQRKILDLGSE